eukprot:jgi/Tetstr1/455427/TSEL_042259.t1
MRNKYLRCLVGEYAPASGLRRSTPCRRRSPPCTSKVACPGGLTGSSPLLGEGGAPDVRHAAVGEAERRAAERAVVDKMKEAYASVFAPSQLGVGFSAGNSMLIHGVRLIAENLGPRAVIIHTDLRNASISHPPSTTNQ